MPVKYDNIAEQYKVGEKAIAKEYVTKSTFLKLCGNLKGKSVLDLACGSGYSTRLLKQLEAKDVVGIDASERQIDLAKEEENRTCLVIKYVVGDVFTYDFSQLGSFDVATALFLLHYSSTKEQLAKMCKQIYTSLKRGGRFVSLNDIPKVSFSDKKYEVTITSEGLLKEGSRLKVTYYSKGKEICSFYTYYWKRETYETALKNAGFRNIKWHKPIISEEGIKMFGKEFWKECLEKPTIVGIECIK